MPQFKERRLSRRAFLSGGAGIVATGLLAGPPSIPESAFAGDARFDPQSWTSVRTQFDLDPRYLHLASFLLAPHPRPVREAIARHRRELDRNPVDYLHSFGASFDADVRSAGAKYIGGEPAQIAITDSTTMGLGLVYGGLKLKPGQEIVTTEHDFYSTHEALRLRAARTGAKVRRIRLYSNPRHASETQIVDMIRQAITRQTRVIALTWVHSSTGVKLPILSISRAITEVNRNRDLADRVLLCVDAVHGLGVEDTRIADLGCDFFIAGTHKWLFGPRGTGIIWTRQGVGDAVLATIPTFDGRHIRAWMRRREPTDVISGPAMTPGGYQSFEHRWALAEAFRFHLQIGKNRIAERTRALSRQLKEGLSKMRRVTVHTPLHDGLSAGIVCLEVDGFRPEVVAARLRDEYRVLASTTPYATSYLRFGPSIVNTTEEVERALRAVGSIIS
jgi:isopenicillin-N epimerase